VAVQFTVFFPLFIYFSFDLVRNARPINFYKRLQSLVASIWVLIVLTTEQTK